MTLWKTLFMLSLLLSSATAISNEPEYILKQGEVEVNVSLLDGFSYTIPDEKLSGFFMDQQRLENTLIDLLNMELVYKYIHEQDLHEKEILNQAPEIVDDRIAKIKLRENFLTNLGYSESELDAIVRDFELKKEYYKLYQKRIFETIEESEIAEVAEEIYLVNKKKYKVPSQRNVSHIFLSTEGLTDTEIQTKKDQAKQLLNQVMDSPEAFNAIAKAHSEDPTVDLNSGDLGWFREDGYDPAIKDAVFSQTQLGIHEEVLNGDKGFYIVKVNDKKDAYYEPFDQVKPMLYKRLKNKLTQSKFQELLTELSTEKIVVNPNSIPFISTRYDKFQKSGLRTVGGS